MNTVMATEDAQLSTLLAAVLCCSVTTIPRVHYYTFGLLKGRCNCCKLSSSAPALSSVALRFCAECTAADPVAEPCANLASSAAIHSGGCDTRWSRQACLYFVCSDSAFCSLLCDAHTVQRQRQKGEGKTERHGDQDALANVAYLLFAIVDSSRIALQQLLLDKSAAHMQAK